MKASVLLYNRQANASVIDVLVSRSFLWLVRISFLALSCQRSLSSRHLNGPHATAVGSKSYAVLAMTTHRLVGGVCVRAPLV